jgi:hypothetical protein
MHRVAVPSRKQVSLEEQAEPILKLIRNARELDRKGRFKSARFALIEARMKLAEAVGDPISRKQAEREIENARVRVRNAANKAEDKLRRLISGSQRWAWTDPDRAIREMRRRYFGAYDELPLTHIEECLVDRGNVLFIMAVYKALSPAILRQLGETAKRRRPR